MITLNERKRKAKSELAQIQQYIMREIGSGGGFLSQVSELMRGVEDGSLVPEQAVSAAKEILRQRANPV